MLSFCRSTISISVININEENYFCAWGTYGEILWKDIDLIRPSCSIPEIAEQIIMNFAYQEDYPNGDEEEYVKKLVTLQYCVHINYYIGAL